MTRGQSIRRTYESIYHDLSAMESPADRALALELHAHLRNDEQLIADLRDLPGLRPRVRWSRGTPSRLHLQIRTSSNVNAVAVAERSDGTPVIISGGADGTIRIWDLDTGEPVADPLQAHQIGVEALELVESPSGTRIVSMGSDATRVWDLDTGRLLGELDGYAGNVEALAVGERSDGTLVIVTGEALTPNWPSTVRIWNLETGEPLGDPLLGHEHSVIAVAVVERPDGRKVIVTASHDNTVRLWDLDTGRPLGLPIEATRFGINALAFGERSDGTLAIITGGDGYAVQVWDLQARRRRLPRLPESARDLLYGEQPSVFALAVAERSDGTRVIVSGATDGTLRLWDLDAHPGRWTRLASPATAPFQGHEDVVLALAVGERSDGTRVIVSSGEDESLRLWNLDIDESPADRWDDVWLDIVAVAVDERSDGTQIIVTASGDDTIRVWDMDTGQPLSDPIDAKWLHTVAVGERSDGTRVIVGAATQSLRFWDLDTGESLGEANEGAERLRTLTVGERSDGTRVIIAATARSSREPNLQIFDLDTGEPLAELATSLGDEVNAVAVGERSDGTRVIIAAGSFEYDPKLRVFDLDTGELLGETSMHLAKVESLALGERSDGSRVIISGGKAGHDPSLQLYNLDTCEPLGPSLRLFERDTPEEEIKSRVANVWALAVGKRSDGVRLIVASSSDDKVRLLDLDTLNLVNTIPVRGISVAVSDATVIVGGPELTTIDL